MSWNAIQESDLLTMIAGPELAAYRAAALAENQPDPIAAQVANVTNMVRGYIAAWTANQLGPEGTIPDKLLQTALDILAVDIPRRCAGTNPTEARETAKKDAIRLLERVSVGTFKLEVPESFTTEKIAIVAPTISTRNRRELERRERGA